MDTSSYREVAHHPDSRDRGLRPSMESIIVCGLNPAPIQQIAQPLDMNVIHADSLEQASSLLSAETPLCVLTNCATPTGLGICLLEVDAPAGRSQPIIAVVEDPWSNEVDNAFSVGVDDYVSLGNLDQLQLKLQALRLRGNAPPPDLSSVVVLADPDRGRRKNLARVLRRLGMDVFFARKYGDFPPPEKVRLVVSHCGLPPEGWSRSRDAFREDSGREVPWVTLGTPDELEMARELGVGEPRLRFFNLRSDPNQLILLANELLKSPLVTKRKSERFAYGAPLSFDIPNSWQQVWSYILNISLGGLFIRTLNPPPMGTEVEMEFPPPFSQERVRVRSKVAWRQEPGCPSGLPSGVGVTFNKFRSKNDQLLLQAGYEKLAAMSPE